MLARPRLPGLVTAAGQWSSDCNINNSTSTDQLSRAIAVVEHRVELLDTKITGIPPPTSLPIPDMKNILNLNPQFPIMTPDYIRAIYPSFVCIKISTQCQKHKLKDQCKDQSPANISHTKETQ